jgi:hypothetical protein
MNTSCPHCGSGVPDGNNICPVCGAFLETRTTAESGEGTEATNLKTEVLRCQNCGSVRSGGEKFCGRCGFLTDEPYICQSCRTKVGVEDRFCTNCGRLIRPDKLYRSQSRPIAALLLGLVPGMFSIWGLGQFFNLSFYKGALFFGLGLALLLVAPTALIVTISGLHELAGIAVLGAVLWCALWVLQAVDAYWGAAGE